ncbi:mannose-1-phosphate guanylyltransferase [Chryseobacterium sp. C-71]|uniref:mannose-1-phosphate guanylyltransferase n=1 Tax=Chryseobacterium sp. C-71 TaxID=2893882 RepID=UPI001E2BF1EC|nr:mannose-1-phosphate guanylyltransferase [Chryseobacterium sp. C-71]UFH33340.1 mannose-1-phosphate guanylyltransferase [Chryseobacterium sp. C-71]
MSKTINVVLTGGVGSRLWPLSRKSSPKQYLDLFEGKSLFQQTVLRNRECCSELFIVGNVDNYLLSIKALKALNIQEFTEIREAIPRNTAAAIAFAALQANEEDILVVTPSDHLIEDEEAYLRSIHHAILLAKEDSIVTFGLNPTKPETGYGYIQIKENKVLSFREKPNAETAREFLKDGNFFWNSGMFCFKAKVFLAELEAYEPALFKAVVKAFNKSEQGQLPLEESLLIPSISVDYAVMERTKKLKAVIGEFRWSDMGSFESIYDYLLGKGHPVDQYGNMVIGTTIHTEFLGINESILIFTEDAILILKKDNAQQVKSIYENLEKNKSKLR